VEPENTASKEEGTRVTFAFARHVNQFLLALAPPAAAAADVMYEREPSIHPQNPNFDQKDFN
jgi:hypothetical protein